MKLEQTKALIAVGASIIANCQPCLQSTITMATESGAGEQEIAEAVEVGRRVRKGAASKMDKFASSLNLAIPLPASSSNEECGCSS